MEQCKTIETLNSLENFIEFLTLTQQWYDSRDLKTPDDDQAFSSDFSTQAERKTFVGYD